MTLAITGPTSGIGIETVKALASKFDHIFLLVRNEDKARHLLPKFTSTDQFNKFDIVYCDWADLAIVSDAARIINVSSAAHTMAKPDVKDLEGQRTFSSWRTYANVKLSNILFTKSLAERYLEKNIFAFALHPGVVRTKFGSELTGILSLVWKLASPFKISPKQGARTSVFLALNPDVPSQTGAYYKKSKVHSSSKDSNSKELRKKLWEISTKLVKPWLSN